MTEPCQIIARAICDRSGCGMPAGEFVTESIVAALTEAGYKIVPRDPSEAMVGIWADFDGTLRPKAAAIWAAMWDRAE